MTRNAEASRTSEPASSDLQQLRREFAELERALGEAEAYCAKLDKDTEDYLAYERQFEYIASRRHAVAALLSAGGHDREGAAQAEFQLRLDLAWRELLESTASIIGRRSQARD